MEHFNQPQRRKAEFMTPPNILKAKVGSGGLAEDILNKAQALLENNNVDFGPLAEIYLEKVANGIEAAKKAKPSDDPEDIIGMMLYPTMQLKANGGMFHYELVTKIANTLIQFLEVIEKADQEAVEVVSAFHTTIKAIIHGKIKGDGGAYGKELHDALLSACNRYFDKYKDNLKPSPN